MFKLFASAALVSLLAACAGTPTSTASMNPGNPDTAAMGAGPMDPGLRNMTGGKAGGPN